MRRFSPPLNEIVLAHQGGWDEALLALTPVALFAGLLWLAKRRVVRELDDDEQR